MNYTMKNIMKTLIIALVLVVAAASAIPAEAQTSTYSTVTSAAVNTTQLCFLVASTTNMQASGAASGPGGTPQEWDLYFDGEFAKINSVNTTSNQVCVTRGKAPTRAGKHPTAALVFFGPAGAVPFIYSAPLVNIPGPPDNRGAFGSCDPTQFSFLPLINVQDGSIWSCLTSARGARWESYSFRMWATGHPVVSIIDAAYTATLADEFINYNSLTTTRILTLPAITGVLGKTLVVLNGGSTSQTITITPVNGQTIGQAAVATLALAGVGNVTRLISVLSSTGAWVWATW